MKNLRNQPSAFVWILFVFSMGILLASCSSSTTPSSGGNNSTSNIIHPKLGSTFTDSSYTRDTTLKIDPTSGTVVVYTLTDTNATIAGISNVFEFTSPVDTFYLHYESNGDVSNYTTFAVFGFSIGTEWVKLPAQSQGTIAMTGINTTLGTDTLNLTGSAVGKGTEPFSVAGQSLSTEKALVTADVYSHATMGHTTGSVSSSFAPSIGFLTKYDLSVSGNYSGFNLNSGTYRFLVSYNLK